MFGSKKRAKVKAEQKRMKDEVIKAKDVKEDTAVMKAAQTWLPKTYGESYRYFSDPFVADSVAPKTEKWGIETSPRPGYDAPDTNDEPETTIEGTLGNGVKFHLEFDDESNKKNLQMIVAVLNLHIAEFSNAEAKVANEAATMKAEAQNREYNENVRRDKNVKEAREHELKVIAAKKDAGIPLAPSQLNGQIGNGNAGTSYTYTMNPDKVTSHI